jgi:hypothetical protein
MVQISWAPTLSHTNNVKRPNPKKNMVYGTLCRSWLWTQLMSTPTHLPWATLCQSRPRPYARVRLYPTVRDLGFGLCTKIFSFKISRVQYTGFYYNQYNIFSWIFSPVLCFQKLTSNTQFLKQWKNVLEHFYILTCIWGLMLMLGCMCATVQGRK